MPEPFYRHGGQVVRDLDELKAIARDIESDVGVRVIVLPTAVLGMGYEITAGQRTYGPLKADTARVWLNGFWSGAIALA